ncbi:two-component response regulator [Oceanobacillus iheyensis HTE831]|uniref:Two-component response regulator n=2 Tax=Oceanobacillus iheyensis TaxID=182710 RepID=Q8ETA4_OCEIH|nr:two-component response regulator [Oceanobacillus iheyensis HTE831]
MKKCRIKEMLETSKVDECNMNILIVEDDKTIATGLEYSLKQEGYDVVVCHKVQEAQRKINNDLDDISLCLFDLSLPDGSGYELCEMVKRKADIPVIFLTVVDDEVNVVMGLDMGADDYITKPFRIRELISRIKTVLRRYEKSKPNKEQLSSVISIGSINIHTLEGKVYKETEEILLTALEYRLLMIFVNHRGQVLSRKQLLQLIWDIAGDFVNDNTLTVYIKRLRKKIEEDAQHPTVIETVRGMGYRMVDTHDKKQ